MFKRCICIPLVLLFLYAACQQTTEQVETMGNVQGTVSRVLPGGTVVVHPAFIFIGDSLLTTTDLQGHYQVTALEIGTYELTSSALFCGDTTLSVQVLGGRTATLDFNLKPESATGKVYGEFQDGTLFQQRLEEDTSLVNWSGKKVFDASTGATLNLKTLGIDVAECMVFLGDSSLATADAWGQYWFTIPCGTFP
ncbi:MAG: carboxypeptidase regulatory-like domain-containing protein, partial [Calditrichaeota bacterium]